MTQALPGAARWDERHRAREVALRALYQAGVGGVTVPEALTLVELSGEDDGVPLDEAARLFAARLASGVWAARDALDAVIGPHCHNWRLERLATLDHLVLQLAVQEWLSEPATPPRVVLSEALELARAYSGDDAVRFVNGVLDAVFRQLKQEGRIID